MMRTSSWLNAAAFALALGGLGLAGPACDRREGAFEEAGEGVDEMREDAEREADRLGDQAEEQAEEFEDQVD